MRAKVIFTPMGNKIKFRVVGKVYCTLNNCELANSATFFTSDLIWNKVFSSWGKGRFLNRNKAIAMILDIKLLGYGTCDRVI